MISDLFEGRRCRCGSRRFSRLYGEETPERVSYITLCESCGHLDRVVFSDTRPRDLLDKAITSTN